MNVTQDDLEGGGGGGEEEGVMVVVGNAAWDKAWEALGADGAESSDLSRSFLFFPEMARWGERERWLNVRGRGLPTNEDWSAGVFLQNWHSLS
jgi:hypothetical protein